MLIPGLLFLSILVFMFLAGGGITDNDKPLLILWVVILGAKLSIGGVLVGLALITPRGNQELYEGGLVFTQGNQPKIIPFDQIITVWQKQIDMSFYSQKPSLGVTKLYGKRLYQYRIETKDQGMVISEIQEIGNYTVEMLKQRELPRLRAIYKQGNDIQLGKLTLNQYGIKYKKKKLPWSKLRSIGINRYYQLIIKSKKNLIFIPWLTIEAEKIPNFPVLWQILMELQIQMGFRLYSN
ncbi:MAG: hypothetical protein F6K40_05030 [Okeania sp. SIO3I5]|nr:DUF6585 family protein [Okeania sp. SIO3I5]NEQ35689.1 hypothetical protein [Okeania sp. SIO3I5]